MVKIPLDEIGGEPNTAPMYQEHPLDSTLTLALQAPKGLLLNYSNETAAQAARFRFYRRIQFHRKNGVRSFDSLVFSLQGTALTIARVAEPEIKVIT